MVQGRKHGQSQTSLPQPVQRPRLSGRASPQQSLKRIGPAISGILQTSVLPRAWNNKVLDESKQQTFRPESGADAFLYIEDRPETDDFDNVREPDPREQKQAIVSLRRSSIPTRKIVLPVSGRVDKHAPSNHTLSERKAEMLPDPPRKKRAQEFPSEEPVAPQRETIMVTLPGRLQPNFKRGRLASKALPSLPPPSPSPRKLSFSQSQRPSSDMFQANQPKVLRGRGPSAMPRACAPQMEPISGSSGSSSGSSYDSAEQTWNMINSMMCAVGEDEVKRVRESIIRPTAQLKAAPTARAPGSYVTFPRAVHPQWDRDESPDGRSSSDWSGWESSVFTPPNRAPSHPRMQNIRDSNRPSPRSTVPSLKRRASVASIFSIVIQPTREFSQEAQDALIAEDDLPQRIRGILQCTHAKYISPLSSRTSTVSSDEAGLHPDLAQTINALRSVSDVELEEFSFDS